jgi:hypothetical protein
MLGGRRTSLICPGIGAATCQPRSRAASFAPIMADGIRRTTYTIGGKAISMLFLPPLADEHPECGDEPPASPRRQYELPAERRRNMTIRLIRGVLGKGRPASMRLAQVRDRVGCEITMRESSMATASDQRGSGPLLADGQTPSKEDAFHNP